MASGHCESLMYPCPSNPGTCYEKVFAPSHCYANDISLFAEQGIWGCVDGALSRGAPCPTPMRKHRVGHALGAPPLPGLPRPPPGLPHYLEVQVTQGVQARLPSLHRPDPLWGPVVLKGLQTAPRLEGGFLEQAPCRGNETPS